MGTQRFIVHDSFWDLFPEASIGFLVARDMKPNKDVPPEDAQAIAALLAQANEDAKRYLASDVISENAVVQTWREAFRKFKTKKGARCSVENLLKRTLKGNPVGSISPSVDIYNAISLTYALPVGGEDVDRFVGDFQLGVDADGGKDFLPLGEDAPDPTLPGEVCYGDDEGAVCRCFNWRDGMRTALTDESRNAFLVIECVDPARKGDLEAALDEFAGLIERYLDARITVRRVVTKDEPVAEIA